MGISVALSHPVLAQPREHAALRRVRLPQAMDVLQASYVRHAFAPHSHQTFVLGVLEHGRAITRFRGATHIAREGSLILLNPGDVHSGEPISPGGYAYRACYPSRELLEQLLGGPAPRLTAPFVADDLLARRASQVLRALWQRGASAGAAAEFHAFVLEVARRHADHGPAPEDALPDKIARARAHIDANYGRRVPIEELARLAELSPAHFIRRFTNMVGLAPRQYLDHVRIQAARDMLERGTTVSDVAYQTGFCDQSHFTRRFKAIVGVPPGRYVRNSR